MEGNCRLCYSNETLSVHIFDEAEKIQLKIMACLPIKITNDDNLPKMICENCHEKVNSFYQFCLTVLETEKRLLRDSTITNAEKTNKNKRPKRKKNPSKTDKPPFKTKFLENNCILNDIEHGENKIPFRLTGNVENEGETVAIKSEKTEDCWENEQDPEYPEKGRVKTEDVELTTEDIGDEKHLLEDDVFDNSDEDDKTFVIEERVKKSKTKKMKLSKSSKKKLKIKLQEVSNVECVIDNGDYDCCICFFKCEGKDKMLEHYRRHNKASSRYYNHPTKVTNDNGVTIEIFECNLCKSVFKNRKEFLSHYTMHRKNNGYRCSLCEKAYSTAGDIMKHGLTHDYQEVNKDNQTDDGKPKTLKLDPSEMRFLCELCDAKFNFFKSAKDHRLFDHPENKDPFLVRCIICREKFSTYWMIRKHLRSHREKLKSLCTICGKYLANNHKLNMHLRIHLGFKPFVCSVCSKAFVNSSRLREHERVHSGARPYKCECGKKFTQRSSLVIHMRSHSGDRPYTCTLCQRGFISRGLLTVHQKTTCI